MDTETAWAAGLFEGEGCITHTGAPGRVPVLVLCTSDEDVFVRFVAAVRVGKSYKRPIRKSHPAHYKPQYEWRACGHNVGYQVLSTFWPWLGERRKARARELFNRPQEVFPAERPVPVISQPVPQEPVMRRHDLWKYRQDAR